MKSVRREGLRLLAVDVDGTLVGRDLCPSPRVTEAVRRATDGGLCVTLASGRGFPSLVRLISLLDLRAPVIGYQGAEIRDAESGKILYQATLPADLVEEVLSIPSGLEVTIHADDRVYLQALRRERSFYDWAFGLPVEIVADFHRVLRRDPLKFLIIGEPDVLDRYEPTLRVRFAGRLQVVRSHHLFLEGVALGVSKGSALTRVAEMLGVDREATVAVGDQDNDISMIRWAGLGVAMGNATAKVKAAADVIAPPVEEDGLAWVIETAMLRRGVGGDGDPRLQSAG
jgi:Cof subfamily protein (haloacid dehalogenase superfamily)